jgi:CBS domain containing-hemolysin-like protein
VTIEDVLEEIVGEIVDEYDTDAEEEIRFLHEKQLEVLGSVHLDTLEDEVGLELPRVDDVDTIAGFVIAQQEEIPDKGTAIRYGDTRITVTEANARRIVRLRIDLDVDEED